MLKRGRRYEVHHAGHCMEVLVCRLLRLPPGAAGDARLATDLVPGHLLVEASTHATEGAHVEAATALAAFAKLLSPLVALEAMPPPPRGWLKQQLAAQQQVQQAQQA